MVELETNIQRLEQQLQKADYLKETGQWEAAVKAYRQVFESVRDYCFQGCLDLGKQLCEAGKFGAASHVFQAANQLSDSAELNLAMAEVQAQQNSEAKIYPEPSAFASTSTADSLASVKLGDALYSQQQWQEAELAYQQSLLADHEVDETVYFKLGNTQFHQNKYEAAIASFRQALKIQPGHPSTYRQMVRAYARIQKFNPRTYFVNSQHNLIYCRIPKNACTLFMTTLVENSEERDIYLKSKMGPHDYVAHHETNLRLTDFAILQRPEYFKFVILRNPLERFVSAYLDKFAKSTRLEKFAQQVVKEVHTDLNLSVGIEESITFSQFVDYVMRTADYSLDPHWRPQHTFLSSGLFEFDFVGQFENLAESIQMLESRPGIQVRTDVSKNNKRGHVTQYAQFDDHTKFHNHSPRALRALGGFPKASQLFTPELEQLVRHRYAQDIEIYEHQFKTTIGSYSNPSASLQLS